MALVHTHFFSPVLNKHVAAMAIVPQFAPPPWATMYLLHGLSDDYTIWHRRTSIERYVDGLPLVVVMPDGFRGFYTDNHEGPAYGRYFTDDVIGFVDRTFHVKRSRSGRCLAGLSMGGYGALRLALSRPELFASAVSHSGAVLAGSRPPAQRPDSPFRQEMRHIFGPRPVGSEHDLKHLGAIKAARSGKLPRLRIDCGTEDFLLEDNRQFHAFLTEKKIPHHYQEHPGAHDWKYWDTHIQSAVSFHAENLGLKRR
jgi:S-formylglutathione hydrolase FrmB